MGASESELLTFLFTDIEGSTRRWEESPTAMAEKVKTHDSLFADSIAHNGGRLIKQTGDGVFAVFDHPREAMATALGTQRSLLDTGDDPLMVRMGIHTGSAVPRGDDLFGTDVNRTARLMGVAHGGQIVVSSAAARLVADDLPVGVALKDLGVHRLRDLSEAINVFQVVAAGLPAEFPPLNSLDGFPNNLPAGVSTFIGRLEDIQSVTDLIASHRLTSLTGAGGSGKTRLALQVAAEALPNFTDGAWFVELAGLTEPDLLPLTIASSLRLSEMAGRSWTEVLLDHVSKRNMLIVLDNCEHVLDQAAETASALLAGAPGLKLLTTTREPLNVTGEVAWRVPPLDLPGADDATLDEILAFEAVQLFVERASAALPGLRLDDSDAPAILEICRRLDGLPLALELAAARVRALSLADIADNLGDRFALLTGGSRSALPRHRTLEGTVAWSYDLLDEEDQEAFRRLSVFSGGFELQGAQVIAGPDAIHRVTSLVEKSLVSARSDFGRTRYRMLETVAAFAHQRLGKEFADVRDTHLQWAAMFAGSAAAELDGSNQADWLDRVSAELDNLRAAMQWALDGGDRSLGMIVAGSLYRFWYIRGVREGRRWLDLFLHTVPDAPPLMKGRVLFAVGSLTQSMGEYERASALLDESMKIFESLGERSGRAYALHYLIRSKWGSVERDELRQMIDEDLSEFREMDDPVGIALTLLFDAVWHMQYGDVDDIETIDELINSARRTGAPQLLAHAAEIPAAVAWYRGDTTKSVPLIAEAAGIYKTIRNQQCAGHCLENAAGWAVKAGKTELAATFFGAADALRADTGIPTPAYEEFVYEDILDEARTALGDAYSEAFGRGQRMTMDEALDSLIALASA